MKLISCHIDAFGKLKNVDVSFNENVTSICEKNGYGKTTLASFIKAMFYGLGANARKNSKLTDRTKYQPFEGGKFGGELVFVSEKGVFKIRRVFNRTATLDEFYLFNAENNLKSDAYSSNIGRELFGVGKETFDATIFFGQKELPSEINDDIKASLSTGKLYGDDVDALSKAVEKIKQKIRELKSELKTLNLESDKARFRELQLKENALTNKISITKNNLAESEEKLKLYQRIKDEMDAKQKEYERLMTEKSATMMYLNETLKEVEDAETQEEEKAEMPKVKKTTLVLSILFFVLSIASIGLFFALDYIAFIVACPVLFILGVVLLVVYLKQKKKDNSLKNEKKLKKTELFDKNTEKSEKIKQKEEEIKKIDEQINLLFDGSPRNFVNYYEEVVSKIGDAQRGVVERENDLKHYQNELDILPITEYDDKLQADTEKSEELNNKIRILETTQNFLLISSENLSSRYVKPVQQKFDEFYKKFITSDELIVDGNLDVHLKQNMLEEGYLSAGVQDLVEICKRFALIDLVFDKEKPFIILDDPFVNLDDKNLEVARQILKNLSQKYQIILLTCHSSRNI
ncbi:MAG TPA: AAA family ATPase [Candidatus Caccovivens faecavium]|nr:AAA family ATPase [Candidatus Caccovivens faecavium]